MYKASFQYGDAVCSFDLWSYQKAANL